MRSIAYSPFALKSIRTELQLTQDRLAELSNISKITITNLERGVNTNPGAELLSSISETLSHAAGYKIVFWIDNPFKKK